ncbi:MAG: 3-phosphoglycerate dehydrogenase [Clostridiales bacterium]|nr:3-phosphoglycerate dehydrogenase [Clostridiales bacterium]
MFKIQTLNKISATGLSHLDPELFEIGGEIDEPDGVILRSFNMHDWPVPKSLKAVARAGAGVNNIPIDKYIENGIVVFNTPGANANAVKELVIAALLMSSRKIYEGVAWARGLAGQEGVAKLVEKGKGQFAGPELNGKTVGVIGLGAIGILVANVCHSLGMNVIGYDPYVSVESAWAISRSVRKAASIDRVYAESDYITLHLPFTKDTAKMINAETIAKMKDGVRVINIARGELADDAAISAAVESGKIAAYVTDFPNENLLGKPGIVTIPHLGASSPESEENCAKMAARQIRDYLVDGNIKNSVTLPDCELPRLPGGRVCVVHRNVPNVIHPMTRAISSRGINIENMVDKSKGDYSYTIFDLNEGSVGDVAEALKAVEGVISVRVI